jgi:hypothetical protein
VPFGISPAFSSFLRRAAQERRRPHRRREGEAGALTFSSVGIGSATHLSAERFRASAGLDLVHVPYKGGAEAMTEVIAGRVDFFFAPVGLAMPNIRDGRLMPLVINGTHRSAALPSVRRRARWASSTRSTRSGSDSSCP